MLKNVMVFLISLLLVLGLAEVGLRLAGAERVKFTEKPRTKWVTVPENIWVEYHPALGWVSQKNKIAHLKTDRVESDVRTNSDGFRGIREYPLARRPGVKRYAALGDSFVFGFGVEDNQSFPALIEAADPALEVLNAGVPGYGIDQIYLSYGELIKKYSPDIVLIGIFPEGFWRSTRSFTDTGHGKPYFALASSGKLVLHNVPVPPPFSINSNQFPSLVEPNFIQKILDHSLIYRMLKRLLIKLGKNLRLIDPDTTDEWRVGREILHQFIGDVRRDGSLPVLVLLPPQDWAQSSRKTSLERSILRLADRENVAVINLKPVFNVAVSRDGLEAYYFKGDWHWNARGQALAAASIRQHLKTMGL